MITDSQIESGQLKADLKEKVTYTLLRKHRHQTKKSNLRSLADIGKTVSSASRIFSSQENGNAETLISPYQLKHLLLIFLFIFNSYCFRLFFFLTQTCPLSLSVSPPPPPYLTVLLFLSFFLSSHGGLYFLTSCIWGAIARNPLEHPVPCLNQQDSEEPCEVMRSSSMGYLCK